MKRIRIFAGSCLLVCSVVLRSARAEEHVFHGEISDTSVRTQRPFLDPVAPRRC